MKEQKYILENISSFGLDHIFDCGQCFRWNKEENGSYTGVIKNGVLNVESISENNGKYTVIFSGICEGNVEELVSEYFDLDRNYDEIKSILKKVDSNMQNAVTYGSGIRLLNQDLWETILSFIISANNNIPRIKGIIERISQKYGSELTYKGKKYYTFPTVEQLRNVSKEDYRDLGAGFRDKYLYSTVEMVLSGKTSLFDLYQIKDTNEVKNELLRLSGVGPKVADCILLFSDLKRLDVFPIDVWVRRVMNDLYIHNKEESKVSQTQIMKMAVEKYGDLSGIAQQYLFYWKRETS